MIDRWPGQEGTQNGGAAGAVFGVREGMEFAANGAVVDAEPIRIRAKDRQIDVREELRVPPVRDGRMPRGEDEGTDPVAHRRFHDAFREGVVRERRAGFLVIGSAGNVDRVMEPDRYLDLVGAVCLVLDPIELLQTLGDVRDDVIVPPRLRIPCEQLAMEYCRVRAGADPAPESPEPPDLQNVKPSST